MLLQEFSDIIYSSANCHPTVALSVVFGNIIGGKILFGHDGGVPSWMRGLFLHTCRNSKDVWRNNNLKDYSIAAT
jgi:hypothetical protein